MKESRFIDMERFILEYKVAGLIIGMITAATVRLLSELVSLSPWIQLTILIVSFVCLSLYWISLALEPSKAKNAGRKKTLHGIGNATDFFVNEKRWATLFLVLWIPCFVLLMVSMITLALGLSGDVANWRIAVPSLVGFVVALYVCLVGPFQFHNMLMARSQRLPKLPL